VTEADGGAAGLAALRAAGAAGAPYDLLLLDQQMPDLDGLQLVARVRAEAPDGAPGDAGAAVARAILMLSSDQRVGDAARARALGITRYLVKPVRRAALLATIVTTLRQHAAPPGARPAPAAAAPAPPLAGGAAAPPPPRQRLLLVDDSADNRRLVQLYLRHLPYDLDTAADGRAGVDAFTGGIYDLVLMDVHMPVMNGLEATRAIRAWEGAQGRLPTPVVALTASAMAEDVRQALAAGCDAHLAKPLKKAILLAALARHAGSAAAPAVPAA
jgi:CheY-like chemotaxis protein